MATQIQNTSYLYRPVLSRAWNIVKKFKNLWPFGLLAVLISSGGEYEILGKALVDSQNQNFFVAFIDAFKSGWQEGRILTAGENLWSVLWSLVTQELTGLSFVLFVFLFIAVLIAVAIWLSISSQIILIKGSSLANKNKKISIAEGFSFSHQYFLPVLLITLFFKIVLFSLIALLNWELWLLSGGGFWSGLLYGISFLFFVSLVLMASFIFKFQTFYIVLKKQRWIASLKSAWQLFINNWLISIEMSLIMFGIYLIAAVASFSLILLVAGIALILIPYYFATLPLLVNSAMTIFFTISAFVGVCLVTAIMTAFQWAGWTVLFEKLDSPSEDFSKLKRLSDDVRNLLRPNSNQ